MNNAMIRTLALCICLAPLLRATEKPNILVILTDDLGYSDLGCYGSEIETPNLDRLAANGLRFSQFYNTAKCHSSRVSLLTGRWCIQAGDTSMKKAVTIPEILAPAGYSTAMTGKWHLDKEPTDFGFQRYFGHLSGATNYYTGDNTFRLNGEKWDVPKEGFYTTAANVDYGLRFIAEARKEKKPWFLYIAFNAPHAPLQPLKQDYEKYRHRYEGGWDEMNTSRFAKQKEVGLLPADTKPSPRPDHIPAWDSLSPEIRDWESRRMAALAGMIDRVDRETGRIIADLEAKGELENTLIVFLSDNGACPYDRRNVGKDEEPYLPGTKWSDSTGWAWARNTPFRYYKQNQFEGGISSPAVFHWPAGIKAPKGSVTDTPAHLVDLLPTLAEIAGAEIPASYPGREPTPLAGISLVPILAGGRVESRPPIHLLFGSDRGLRDGDWKLVSFKSLPWELYDMSKDRTELNNLASKQPERVAVMAKAWHEIAKETMGMDAKPVASEDKPKTNAEWSDYSGRKTPKRKK
ncbi:arylsulfatase [Akkermansiaceae bacterium]|nr:arylsulfatase [Akkermansiaceae bacterium]